MTSPIRQRFQEIASRNKKAESAGEFAKRNIGQHAARAGEVFLGTPGNIKNAFQNSLKSFESFLGTDEPSLEELEQKGGGSPEKGSVHELFMNPPTTSELRETVTPLVAEKLTGDKKYLEPKGGKEEAAGELTEDIAAFFTPGTGQSKLAVKLGAPIAGNLAEQGIKYLGGSQETAEKAKIGIMLGTSLAGQSNPAKFASKNIGKAKQMIPRDATASTSSLSNPLIDIYQDLSKGLKVPSKSRTMEGIEQLIDQTSKNGRISMHSLMDARDNINEWIAEAGGWDVPGPTKEASVRNLNRLKSAVIDTIDQNMQSRFPQAADLYKTGYEAAAVTHKSNAISNFIEKNFGKKVSSIGAKLLFPSIVGGAAVIPKTAAIATAGYPIYKAGQVLYRIGQSPTLGMYYQDVIKHSLQGNAAAMVKSMEKLDAELAKDERKQGIKPSLEEFKQRFKKKG